MRSQHLAFIVFVFVLALCLPVAAGAQGSVQPTYVPPAPDAFPAGDEAKPFLERQTVAGSLDSPATPDITIGQPGLSFRYVRTFGETETAYPEDTSHFYNVQGLGVVGNQIWVTDSWSDRVLKFDASGNFLQQIGKAGFRDSTGTSLDYVTDVAVDSSGNIWVVDGGAAHVVKYNAAGNRVSELGQAWTSGSDNAHFNDPISIAFDAAGNIYVSDSGVWGDYGNHRVQVFNSSGAYLATIGQTGVAGSDNGHFRRPRGIAVYGNRLYVADAGNHRVQIFDITNPASPSYVATVGTGVRGNLYLQFDFPEGVGVDANYIYVADSNNQRIQIFDRNTLFYNGLTIGAGTWGTDNNHFNHPTDVVVDAAGNIYVADNWNKRVQQFNSSRVYQRTYGTTGVSYVTDGYHYYFPKGVAVGQDGSIHIVEERGHRLVKLDANGTLQWTVGQPGQTGNDNSHFAGPQDVAVDAQGRVYVVENWDVNRVQIFSSDGAYYATLGAGSGTGPNQFKGPEGITVDSAGMIYVADRDNHRVQIFNSARAYVATLGQTGVADNDNDHFNRPYDVAVDGNGVIYVADEGNDRVQVFDSNRNYVRTIGGGGTGNDFGHFDGWGPHRLAVDTQNRLYVADSGNNRIQVFDATGAYLTTIGGSWGSRTGQFRGPFGIAIGPDGAVFVADHDNNRIQKFAPGVPGWRQVNINGFGDRRAQWISSLLPFEGSLYAAGYPARVWRMTPSGDWSQINTDGFGDGTNTEIDALADFDNYLYAATYTWVCDDTNCNTGHTTGPQIWRSADGGTWQNVTPAGGIGSGDRYVASFAVFDGQLYAGLGYNNTGHGAEIWRTADGLTWTRVAENGFANDIYNTDVLSLVVYDGNLYAGTRHGDWHDDDHANGPLGGEIWRSDNGTAWTRVNAPGFGTLEAHRVESLVVFQNGLYAYVSHVGGTAAGADVWRCTKAICAEQADWTKVAENGFGVPQNQYLYTGAVFGGYLYGAVYNATTGMQLWRTANGSDWEKATPYDGFGNSNNRYVSNHAMAVFNERLTLGVTNGTNGAGVWQKTLTADFTATPTRGAPPLAVQFTNTSAGDFTLSQWDFGDGGWSEATNPSHLYTAAGTYTVTLRVSAGMEGSTITKAAYIDVHQRVFLPLVLKNYDPLLYDNFDDPTWDGAWNPAKWRFEGNAALFRAIQQNGSLTFTSGGNVPAGQGAALKMISPDGRSLGQLRVFEARVKLSSDHRGGFVSVHPFIDANPINGHGWWTQCVLSAGADRKPFVNCDVYTYVGATYTPEYDTADYQAQYDTWYTLRIEADPTTAHLKFYLDGRLIGEHTPNDAAALIVATNLRPDVSVWNGEANASATRYVDDVRITPAR